MPAVNNANNRRLALFTKEIQASEVGDLCYIAYQFMINEWEKTPRWTTAHKLYRNLHSIFTNIYVNYPRAPHLDMTDVQKAVELAWEVFFMKFVWPYEIQKFAENGDIKAIHLNQWDGQSQGE